jgi:hypothetical protein
MQGLALQGRRAKLGREPPGGVVSHTPCDAEAPPQLDDDGTGAVFSALRFEEGRDGFEIAAARRASR